MRARRKPRTAAELRRAATSRTVHSSAALCLHSSQSHRWHVVGRTLHHPRHHLYCYIAGAPPRLRRGGQNWDDPTDRICRGAPSYISCDILCIRSENIQRANTQNWIPLRLIDTHPYPKAGVLLQGKKTHALGTANPHSIYPVHISILRPMQRVYDSVYDNDRGRRWAHPGRGFPPEKRGRNNSAAKLHKSSPTDRRSPSESPTSAVPGEQGLRP